MKLKHDAQLNYFVYNKSLIIYLYIETNKRLSETMPADVDLLAHRSEMDMHHFKMNAHHSKMDAYHLEMDGNRVTLHF